MTILFLSILVKCVVGDGFSKSKKTRGTLSSKASEKITLLK